MDFYFMDWRKRILMGRKSNTSCTLIIKLITKNKGRQIKKEAQEK
jgi:hypothetical protein